MKPHSSLQERLASQGVLLGLMQTHPSAFIPELAGACGYDFVILDGEHGMFSQQDYLHALHALSSTDAFALVRLEESDPHAVGRYLDMGVAGIVAPNVNTAERARTLARAMEYPPAGTRGFGASAHRATKYGLELTEHLKAPRRGASLIVMIESKQGVSNVDDILAVEGVDGVFIGPFDLSADLSSAGDFSQPAYAHALESIERAAARHGKVYGTGPHAAYTLESLIARGHRLLMLGNEVALIREAMSTLLAKGRSQV